MLVPSAEAQYNGIAKLLICSYVRVGVSGFKEKIGTHPRADT